MSETQITPTDSCESSPISESKTSLARLLAAGLTVEQIMTNLIQVSQKTTQSLPLVMETHRKTCRPRSNTMEEAAEEEKPTRFRINPGPVCVETVFVAPAARTAVQEFAYVELYHFTDAGMEAYRSLMRGGTKQYLANQAVAFDTATANAILPLEIAEENLSEDDYRIGWINLLQVMRESKMPSESIKMHTEFFTNLPFHRIFRWKYGKKALRRVSPILREAWSVPTLGDRKDLANFGGSVEELIMRTYEEVKEEESAKKLAMILQPFQPA